MLLRAVFFDLYETLITEHDPHGTPLLLVADYLGVNATRFKEEWQARLMARLTGVYPDYASVLRDICHELGQPANEEVIHYLYTQRVAAKATPFERVEVAVLEALRHIRRRGMKIGVISNCTSEEVAAWSSSVLRAYVDDIVLSYQVGYAKPDVVIYQLACRQLQVAPEQAIFVGDGNSAELTGATQSGMVAYHATWFLDRWPTWRHVGRVDEGAWSYPRLSTLAELIATIKA